MENRLVKRLTGFVSLMLLLSQLIAPIVVAAEEEIELVDFLVGAYTCEASPGDFPSIGALPPGCLPIPGLPISAQANGVAIGSCVTDGNGSCWLGVPTNSDIVLFAESDRPFQMNPLPASISQGNAVFVHVLPPVSPPPDLAGPPPDAGDGEIPDDGTDPGEGEAPDDGTDPGEGEAPDDGTDPGEGETPDDGTGPGEGELPDDGTDPGEGETPGDGTDPGEGETPDEGSQPDEPDGLHDGIDADDEEGSDQTDTGEKDELESETTPVVGYVINTGEEGLACYANPIPAADEDSLHVFSEGDEITILGDSEEGVLRVQCTETEEGFVDATYVGFEPPVSDAESQGDLTPLAVISQEMVLVSTTCYVDADSSSAEIALVTANSFIDVTGAPAGDWLPVKCIDSNDESVDGFVRAIHTTAVPQPEMKPAISRELVTQPLICYTAPSESSTAIESANAGDFIWRTGSTVNGWLPVQCGDRDGWVLVSSTSLDRTTTKPVLSRELITQALTCYTAPSTDSTVIKTANAGQWIRRTGSPVDGWLPVQCSGRDAWVLLSSTSMDRTTTKPVLSRELITQNLACYTAPFTDSTVIKTANAGQWIRRTGSPVGAWLPVQCGGRDAWVLVSSTTSRATLSPVLSRELITQALTCYTAPFTDSTVIKNANAGQWIRRIGSPVGAWLPVQCGGRDAWVLVASTSVRATLSPVLSRELITQKLTCYTAPFTDATAIKTANAGQWIRRTGSPVGAWLPVQCGGRDAWVLVASTTSRATLSPVLSREMATRSLTCYTAPFTDGTVITTISQNTLVGRTGNAVGQWLPIQCGERDGWVQLQYTTMNRNVPLKGATGRTSILSTGRSGTVCRTAPTHESSAITTLREGAYVNTTGSSVHNWVPVQCANRNGYIHLASTTLQIAYRSGDAKSWPAVVMGTGNAGLICRTSPGGARITTMPERTPVDVMSWSNGWARVRCAGTTGYADMRYLTFSTAQPGATSESVWIDVNLSTQYMVVYQGERIIGQAYVSTGRYPTFETPTGTFYIINKIWNSPMAGCSGGECWYVPDVPYQMYFTNRGHAFHGTYWHDNYGTRMSHGCVNLPIGTAEWLYNITPYGTRVVIHY